MSVDHIRYDLLAQEALRSVVRRVLMDVARGGLPGEHHFYISFDTHAPGVRISPRMLEKYPEEMTIVLQHQFWDLIVSDASFEVGLSFGGIPERLVVPFSALKGFFDPSVKFGLQFELAAQDGEASELDELPAEPPRSANAPAALKPARGAASEPALASAQTSVPGAAKPGAVKPTTAKPALAKATEAETSAPDDAADRPASGAQVVQLDVFRNKK
ncbi:Stringent starvation protein B [Xanthobacter dioxanivorans]|uniref:Stringent starvation protein B n=1 Tax=Xanthobacter dioxanivorans TaxID=2528964 RepID=A0A974PNK5_9HYPH|nr:ClpXP protease specificity-enhancing factor SspB [Xanthobacter dioxanivorans]QRG06511.1 Stringent starvation protein B [Xanthobacter dioxanivorans]